MSTLLNRCHVMDGHRIACGIHGDGPPVVLIHGTPSSSHIWRRIVPALSAAGRQIYVFGLLGYGRSDRPWDSRADSSVSGQVSVVLSLMRHWAPIPATAPRISSHMTLVEASPSAWASSIPSRLPA